MMASLSSSTTFMFTFALFAIAVSTVSVSANKINVDNWFLPYAGPKTLDAKVGETIVFEWGSGHNVFIHPTMNCELDGAIAVGSESPALYTFTEADSGTDMFFSCDIGAGAHCQNGKYNCTRMQL
ncbi:MAG: plastocyanin [Bacillariaceae sp.]|jgi:plastocyanin